MSILPATDIVADAARAADPERLKMAMRRLAQAAKGENARSAFAAVLDESAARPKAYSLGHANVRTEAAGPSRRVNANTTLPEAARKFEAFLLQSFLETLLPKDDRAYGQGTAGGIWRSMTAEQLGAQLAKRGALGLDKIFERRFGAQDLAANNAAALGSAS